MDYKLLLIAIFIRMASCSIPGVLDFFPGLEDDLSNVVWGHAINSKALLENAILSKSYMMLEADVVKGHLEKQPLTSDPIPIMGHPPQNVSDISLVSWVDRVIEANKQGVKIGIKLDFKETEIASASLKILRRKKKMFTFPVWLNADILQGPGGENGIPVEADIFLSSCTEFFGDATLSLGWTTGYEPGEKQMYNTRMIEEMIHTLSENNVNQPVTFPIRAAFVGRSLEALTDLANHNLNNTFTVWTSAKDDVDIKDLVQFQKRIGSDSVYFDLPEKQLKELKDLSKALPFQHSFAAPRDTFDNLFMCICGLISSLLIAFAFTQ